MNTSELTGAALDWAVAKCEGYSGEQASDVMYCDSKAFCYSTDWSQAGPIIEREKITLDYFPDGNHENGGAWLGQTWDENGNPVAEELGPTPLIAAMRAYVASKLGDEVDVPEELQ